MLGSGFVCQVYRLFMEESHSSSTQSNQDDPPQRRHLNPLVSPVMRLITPTAAPWALSAVEFVLLKCGIYH